VRPPYADGVATGTWRGVGAPAARRRGRWPRVAGLSPRARLTALAALVLVAALGAAAYVAERPGARGSAGATNSTAFLGTATCADWRAAGDPRRLEIIRALGIAATQPDPENPGATLSQGAAYGLFERACATSASHSVLLYETYNRSASMSAARASASPGWGTATHH
jgi:hypothetical protein